LPLHRTTFTRQAANLWAVKAQLRQQLLGRVGFDPGHLDPGQLPGAGLPLRPCLALPA
jgi:hypothetical protein